MKCVARHFNTPVGELDLVMQADRAVVFVEVKCRRSCTHAAPEEAVTPAKQGRLLRAADWFLAHKRWQDRPCRFDVVAIVLPADGPARVTHFADAFGPRR